MSKKIKRPPKWTQVYPKGTKEGNEEQAFFTQLARHPKYTWRSTAALSKETGLSNKRIEEIFQKYYKKKMVFLCPKNESMMGYWERNLDMLEEEKPTVVEKDQDKRIDGVADYIQQLKKAMTAKSESKPMEDNGQLLFDFAKPTVLKFKSDQILQLKIGDGTKQYPEGYVRSKYPTNYAADMKFLKEMQKQKK